MKTEALVMQIMEKVIGVQNLSREARFLDVGGNSLNLVQVLKEIREKTGVSPSPRLFFDKTNSTVAGISAAIDQQWQARQSTAAVGS